MKYLGSTFGHCSRTLRSSPVNNEAPPRLLADRRVGVGAGRLCQTVAVNRSFVIDTHSCLSRDIMQRRDIMATLTLPDHIFARLQAAAAARHVSIETYLDELSSASIEGNSVAKRTAAADSIRRLAAQIKNKATIDELAGHKHQGHKY
jgi:hypothetical protein